MEKKKSSGRSVTANTDDKLKTVSSDRKNAKSKKSLKKQHSSLSVEVDAPEPDGIDPAALARGDEPMSVVEHLEELRKRIIYIIVSFFLIACLAFFLSDWLLFLINKPFLETGSRLNIFTMVGSFMMRMKLAAATSLLFTVPLVFFHIWRFISPAIDRPERFFSRTTLIISVVLFYSGLCLVFFTIPSVVKVLLGFISPSMTSTIDGSDYLHFIFFMSLVMGIIFELPVIVLVLTRIGLITPQFLIRKRKYAILIIWLTAAVITPGADLLSQSLLAIPLMLLYEVSILFSKFVLIRKKKKELKLRNF